MTRRRAGSPPRGTRRVAPFGCLIVLVLVLLPTHHADGQVPARFEVPVRVVSEAGGGIDGAVVRLVDADGRPRTAATTDRDGHATLVVPEPGRYRFVVDRIGFAFWESDLRDLFAPPGEAIELVVPLAPVTLDGIDVFIEGRCSPERPILVRVFRSLVRRPSSALTHEDRVRLAMVRERTMLALATVIGNRPPGGGWEVFATESRPRTFVDHLLFREAGESSDTVRVRGSAPYEVPPLEHLAERGYVEPMVPPNEPAIYHPLTPEAVISEGFQRTHCFQVVDRPGTSWVGLAFEPVPDHPNTDVRGVVWMDSLTWQPREIEYEYTRLAESFVESGEWAAAIRESRARRGTFLQDETMEVRARAPHRNIVGVGLRILPTPNEREFGGRIEFGAVLEGRWDVIHSEHYWPSLLGHVHVESGAIVIRNTRPALEAVTVSSARVLRNVRTEEPVRRDRVGRYP